MYAVVAMAALTAISSAFSASNAAKQAKLQAELSAMQHEANAEMARMNAAQKRFELVSQSKAYEMQGAIQGFKDGAAMADTRASQASSGVYMDSASSYQVRASQNMMHKATMANIDSNRIYNQTAMMNQALNYETTALIEDAQMSMMSGIASSINPSQAGFMSGALAFGTTMAAGWANGAFDGTSATASTGGQVSATPDLTASYLTPTSSLGMSAPAQATVSHMDLFGPSMTAFV